MKHSPVLLFCDHYWNTQCVEDALDAANVIPPPSEYTSFCEYLSIREDNICFNPLCPLCPPSPACLTAKDRHESICGTGPQEEQEGSGISGYEEGSGASGIILADVEMWNYQAIWFSDFPNSSNHVLNKLYQWLHRAKFSVCLIKRAENENLFRINSIF